MLSAEDWDEIASDLAPFADLGTFAPAVIDSESGSGVRLIRNGEALVLSERLDGKLTVDVEGKQQTFIHFKSLLASPLFANLGGWARNQSLSLSNFEKIELIETQAQSKQGLRGDPLDILENFFANSRAKNGLAIAFFDGPAGIGKTTMLQYFAFRRASNYLSQQSPLVLHIQSKGKILQNIFDLIALNLQVLRSQVTFDQVPTLAKHGLITIVIDGFDELGDPNGYELAWSQLNEFLLSVRGEAEIVLSGRETFVSEETMLKALPAVDTKTDQIESISVLPTEPVVARRWLRAEGWSDDALQAEEISDLLSEGSYALRPFFLNLLAEDGLHAKISTGEVDELLPFLMNELLKREATKFGEDVDRLITETEREQFVSTLMVEVARDLADSQSDSIQTTNLSWLSDVASIGFPEEIRGILRNRANVIAFLTEDAQPNRVRFFHESVFQYWLSKATFSTLINHEIPKYLRRNILSSDFLEIWNEFCQKSSQGELDSIRNFIAQTIASAGERDRTRRNLLALFCSVSSIFSDSGADLEFRDITIEELIFRETSIAFTLKNTFISQLDARGADISDVAFDSCQVHTAIFDTGSRIPNDFPVPSIIVTEAREIKQRESIQQWLFEATHEPVEFSKIFENVTSRIPHIALLQRLARFRRYWIKDDEDDPAARKILNDEYWPELAEVLVESDFMVKADNLATSGRPSTFYHLKNREAFQDIGHPSDELLAVVRKLAERRRED